MKSGIAKSAIVYIIALVMLHMFMFAGCDSDKINKSPSASGGAVNQSPGKTVEKTPDLPSASKSHSGTANTSTRPSTDPDGNNNNNNNNNNNSNNNDNEDDPDPSEEDPGIEVPGGEKYDLGGKTVKISVWPAYPKENDIKAWLREKVSEKYNFTVEYEMGGFDDVLYNSFISAFMSGTFFADVIMVRGEQAFPFMVQRQMIHALDDYIDFNNGLYANRYQQNTLWKGKHYGLQDGPNMMPPRNLLTYNKDIIAAAGQPDPKNLQNQGNWNFETFRDITDACSTDKDGNGIIDIWGISMYQEIFTRNMLYANGCDYTRYIDGKYVFALDEDRAMQTITYIGDLIHYYKAAIADKGEKFNKGKAAFTSNVLSYRTGYPQNCGIVYYPKGPNANDYVSISTHMPFYALPVNSEIPINVLAPVLAEMWAYWNPANERSMSFEEDIIEWASTQLCSDADVDILIDAALNRLTVPAHSNFYEFTKLIETEVFSKIPTLAYMPDIIANIKPQASAILEQY